VKSKFFRNTDFNFGTLDVFIEYFTGQFLAGGQKLAGIKQAVINGSI